MLKISKNPVHLKITALICLLVLTFGKAGAQSGQYIQVWGGPQFVSILNFDDYNTTNLGYGRADSATYRVGAGFDYINNFNQNYGWQTGIYYSGQGQKYYGYAKDFYSKRDTAGNPLDSTPHAYNSQVWMDYIRVPLMFRFNSLLDEGDRINLSIFLGLQAGYLTSIRSYTNPPIPDTVLAKFPNPETIYKKLYHAIDFGLSAGAQMNAKLNNNLYANLGVRFDRSLMNIENTSYVLPDNAPVEWIYPLSTKKETRITHADIQSRMASKNISLNVYLGISFRIKAGKEEKPNPDNGLTD